MRIAFSLLYCQRQFGVIGHHGVGDKAEGLLTDLVWRILAHLDHITAFDVHAALAAYQLTTRLQNRIRRVWESSAGRQVDRATDIEIKLDAVDRPEVYLASIADAWRCGFHLSPGSRLDFRCPKHRGSALVSFVIIPAAAVMRQVSFDQVALN